MNSQINPSLRHFTKYTSFPHKINLQHGFYGGKVWCGDPNPFQTSRQVLACGEVMPYMYINLDVVTQTYFVAASFGAHRESHKHSSEHLHVSI